MTRERKKKSEKSQGRKINRTALGVVLDMGHKKREETKRSPTFLFRVLKK